MKLKREQSQAIVVGGGFTGLSTAYELAKRGVPVTLLEGNSELGGLAGSFAVNGAKVEKFYHHWFTNDTHVFDLVKELGAGDQVVRRSTQTGMYYASNRFRLSTPFDLLTFKPLKPLDRLRLALLVLHVRRIKDWKQLDQLSAEEWLTRTCGPQVFQVVWAPLLQGKFGKFSSEVSASWFWSKLKLRGGSRGRRGQEMLAYFQGGFAALADRVAAEVESRGGRIRTGDRVRSIAVENGRVAGVEIGNEVLRGAAVILTPALPIIRELIGEKVSDRFLNQLSRIEYLANICLVLQLDRSLSSTYWLNVNDPSFPFVGIIEHTNFEPPESYGGKHIVYLSKYLTSCSEQYQMTDQEFFEFSLPYLKRMFPELARDWIQDFHVWRARYAQPIVVRNYSEMIPPVETPIDGLYITTMAQVYPEDRGTNYAIRDGRRVGRLVARKLRFSA